VTVCIAAICGTVDNQVIVGAADRMITSGDVEYELVGRSTTLRPVLKAVRIAPAIIVMTGGDAGFQADAIHHLAQRLDGVQRPSVRDVATMYRDFINDSKQQIATTRVLSALGLTSNTFISRQRELNDDFVQRVTSELWRLRINAEAIITGIDATGTHIYVVSEDEFRCDDPIAFAAIGYGARHAESQFMLAKHTRHAAPRETLLLTYIAKKRSEVAPGVGSETDMFSISQKDGLIWLTQEHIKSLQAIYDKLETEQLEAFDHAGHAWRDYLSEVDAKLAAKKDDQSKTDRPETT
jgi:chlorite dismutase